LGMAVLPWGGCWGVAVPRAEVALAVGDGGVAVVGAWDAADGAAGGDAGGHASGLLLPSGHEIPRREACGVGWWYANQQGSGSS